MNWTGKRLILIVCLAFLVGCNGKNKTIEVIGENPIILVHHLEGGMEAEITGILVYDQASKFLLLENPNAQEPTYYTPIWPKKTKPIVENEQHGVEIPGYGKVIEGDSIIASGGGIERKDLDDLNIPDQLFDADAFVAISKMVK